PDDLEPPRAGWRFRLVVHAMEPTITSLVGTRCKRGRGRRGPRIARAVAMPAMARTPLTHAEIAAKIRELTLLLYDTSVPLATLEERVVPYLSPRVAFIDPWIIARGRRKFRIGLRGFHCAIRFDFEIKQLAVELDGRRGRALVEGVMNLRQLRVYTYPL